MCRKLKSTAKIFETLSIAEISYSNNWMSSCFYFTMGHNMYAQTRGLVTCGTFVRGYISPIFGMSTHLTFQLTDCVQTLIEFFCISHLPGTEEGMSK